MKTKLIALLLLTTATSFSQSMESLMANTKKLYDANYNMDFDAVANLTYPKIYEQKGKTVFTEKLDADYQNDEFRMRLELLTPMFLYSELKKIEDKSFYIVSYRNPIRYFFESKLNADSAGNKVAWLKDNNNASDVLYEPIRYSLNVKRNSKYIAVSDESTNGEWKFFNFDDQSQRQSFEALFKADVKKALGL
jgi:hypothetical protein